MSNNIPVPGSDQGGITCIICDVDIQRTAVSPVFPSWVLERFSLANHEYVPNGDVSTYGYVPTCSACENRLKTSVEDPVRNWVDDPNLEVDPDVLLVWLCHKLYSATAFGSLHLGNGDFLYTSGPQPAGTPLDLGPYQQVLRSFGRHSDHIEPRSWSSLFTYRTQTSEVPTHNFAFMHDPRNGVTVVRLGSVGLVGLLFDGGMGQYFEHFEKAHEAEPLSPVQFEEIAAFGLSIGLTLMPRKSPVVRIHDDRLDIGISMNRYSVEAFRHVYPRVLADMWSRDIAELFNNQGEILSTLFDPDGQPLHLGFRQSVKWPSHELGAKQ